MHFLTPIIYFNLSLASFQSLAIDDVDDDGTMSASGTERTKIKVTRSAASCEFNRWMQHTG